MYQQYCKILDYVKSFSTQFYHFIMYTGFTLLLLVIVCITTTISYQILGVFPHPGISHFHFFQPILRGLAEAGHDVTVISHFPDKSPPAHYRDLPLTGVSTLKDSVDLKVFENRRFYNHFLEFFMLYEWGKEACELLLKSDALATVLKSNKRYDVILMEQFNIDCAMGIGHILKAPVIGLSSCALMPWHYNRVGLPLNPSYIPALFMGQNENMSFFYRMANWITAHGMNFLYKQFNQKAANDLIRKKFGNEIPDMEELVKDTVLMFVNQHFSLSGAKPLSPAVIELGGIHIQKAKSLDISIQRLLDAAEHGVVYISWGSMIRLETLPSEKRDAIIKAVGRLSQTVLMKWENDSLPKQPSNVHVRKWMPQREILCHPNVKVFLSHGGLMGSSEAAYCGVPVVVTPMYGDQFLNAAALEHRGMGIILNYEDIKESTVYKTIKKALDPKVMSAAKAVSYSYRNRPHKALELAIWWVEYVAKTEGAPLLQSVSTYLPFYSYYCLDIYLFFITILFFCTASWIWLFQKFFSKNKHILKIKQN